MPILTVRQARRLALARAGLLKPEWTRMPRRAAGAGKRARNGALAVIERFGYLQLDTVSVAGARSHVLVLLSRLEGLDPAVGERLLRPGEPLFEYWGHEASWIPLDLYPAFAFRRREFEEHPWWGDVVGEHPQVADELRRRLRDEGPMRSLDLEGGSAAGWWDIGVAKRVAATLWSSGEIAIRERRNFQRIFDLAERVIPAAIRRSGLPEVEGVEMLLLKALDGHGWASLGTMAATWRLKNRRRQLLEILEDLRHRREVVRCGLERDDGRSVDGWIRPSDLELAARLDAVRPRTDRGVLLSPFDPVLWDRRRVETLFDFEQVLEIYKPAAERKYGYYCLPVLAGEELVARVDLKADRKRGVLSVLSCHFEVPDSRSGAGARNVTAVTSALERYADAIDCEVVGAPD